MAVFVVGVKVDRWLATRPFNAQRPPDTTRIVIPSPNDLPRRQVDVVQPSPRAPSPPVAEPPRVITTCIVDGRVFHAENGRCALPRATVTADGPDGTYGSVQGLTAYQREMLRSADARIARDAAAARADSIARQQAQVSNRGECAALFESIRSLDSWARQPLSGNQQDDIRRRRQALTSRQFELRC